MCSINISTFKKFSLSLWWQKTTTHTLPCPFFLIIKTVNHNVYQKHFRVINFKLQRQKIGFSTMINDYIDIILVQIPKHEKKPRCILYYFILFTGSLYSQYATGLSQPRNFSSWSCEIFVAIQLSEHKKQRSVGQLIRCKYLRSISSPKLFNFKMFLSSTDVHLVISLIIIYWLGLSRCWWKSKWSLYQKQGESLKLSEIIFFFFLFISFFISFSSLPSSLPPPLSFFSFFLFNKCTACLIVQQL